MWHEEMEILYRKYIGNRPIPCYFHSSHFMITCYSSRKIWILSATKEQQVKVDLDTNLVRSWMILGKGGNKSRLCSITTTLIAVLIL